MLFYASNTKIPGVTALAVVVKESYPDFNAWDENHPYFDPKSRSESPTWFMVDVKFSQRLNHLVGLKVLQVLAELSSPPDCVASYLTQEHLDAIKTMPLLSRARLSVQKADCVVTTSSPWKIGTILTSPHCLGIRCDSTLGNSWRLGRTLGKEES